jgi:hypothetical protein
MASKNTLQPASYRYVHTLQQTTLDSKIQDELQSIVITSIISEVNNKSNYDPQTTSELTVTHWQAYSFVWRKPAARGCHAEQLNKLETERNKELAF